MRAAAASLLCLTLATAVAASAAGAGQRSPQLRLLSRAPVTVAGSGFSRRERVVVRVTGMSAAKAVRASATGTFTVRFNATSDGCNAILLLTARGATGDSATFKANARACPPAP